jgi:hypothetical protein
MGNKFASFEHLLLPEEQLVYSTEVLGGVAKNRAIALTNRRFIMIEDGFKSNYTSIFYSEITDVSAEKRIRRLEIMLRASGINEPVSFGLRDMNSAAEVCEKINMHIRATRGRTNAQSAMPAWDRVANYTNEAQLYAVKQTQNVYIGLAEMKTLVRRETATPVIIDEQNSKGKVVKAYFSSVGRKSTFASGKAIVLAKGVGNATLSYILKSIKGGMPVLIDIARGSMNSFVLIYPGRKARKDDGVDLGGYRIAARTGAFSYNFLDGSLNGIAAIDGRGRSKTLNQNDLKIFSHRRVRESFGSTN